MSPWALGKYKSIIFQMINQFTKCENKLLQPPTNVTQWKWTFPSFIKFSACVTATIILVFQTFSSFMNTPYIHSS